MVVCQVQRLARSRTLEPVPHLQHWTALRANFVAHFRDSAFEHRCAWALRPTDPACPLLFRAPSKRRFSSSPQLLAPSGPRAAFFTLEAVAAAQFHREARPT